MNTLLLIPLVFIRFIVANPGEDASREVNISWHTDAPGSVLQLSTGSDVTFANAVTINPTSEVMWCYERGDSLFQKSRYVCRAELKGLRKGTNYIYRIVNGDTGSEVCQFCTAAGARTKKAQEWVFTAFTDFQTAENPNSIPLIAKITEIAGSPSLMLCSGDMTDYGSRETDWRWILDNKHFRKCLYAATPGDHEYWGIKLSPSDKHIPMMDLPHTFYAMFDFPKNGIEERRGSNYYFYYNNILFVGLDMGDSNTCRSEMFNHEAEWFKSTIGRLKGTYRYLVVYGHKSIYGSYKTDACVFKSMNPLWAPVFKEAGVDLVLSGHDHMFSRTREIDGTYYLDMGSSGRKFRTPDEELSTDGLHETVINLKETQQSMGAVITVDNKQMSVNVYDKTGAVFDHFTIKAKK